MKLLCFPHAGGTSEACLKWEKYSDGIELIPVDPPGRGKRMAEPLCKTIGEMVEDVLKQMRMLIDPEEEYAVYGHSMGCLLIYEALHELWEAGFPMPVHVFLSGKNPPHIAIETPIHQLNDSEFIENLVKIGGVEAKFFENPIIGKLFLPVLRADMFIVGTYCCKTKRRQLPVDVSYFFALNDPLINFTYVKQWSNYIEGSFRIYCFEGGHFFMLEHSEELIGIVKKTLLDGREIVPY